MIDSYLFNLELNFLGFIYLLRIIVWSFCFVLFFSPFWHVWPTKHGYKTFAISTKHPRHCLPFFVTSPRGHPGYTDRQTLQTLPFWDQHYSAWQRSVLYGEGKGYLLNANRGRVCGAGRDTYASPAVNHGAPLPGGSPPDHHSAGLYD